MRLLVSGATATLRRHPGSPYLGALVVPGAGNSLNAIRATGLPWAADNAAFTGFDAAAFCRMLGRIAGHPGCRFVACPDVVGDAAATLDLFIVWAPIIRALGLPVALVAQDGLDPAAAPWGSIDALFVGGSTEWKMGAAAAGVVREAAGRGKWVHFGRCNTRKRFRYAYQLGCDSVDGSGFSRWPDQRVPAAVRWLRELHGEADPAPDRPAGEFFSGGLGGTLFDQPGWTVEDVEIGPAGYEVRARYLVEPTECPWCRKTPPDATWLYRHGEKVTRVRDRPRHGRPVFLVVTRPRFRCRACSRTFVPHPTGVLPDFRLTEAAADLLTDEAAGVPGVRLARALGVDDRTVRRVRARASPSG